MPQIIKAKYSVTGFKQMHKPWRFPFKDCVEVGMQFFVPKMTPRQIWGYIAYAHKILKPWRFKTEAGARTRNGKQVFGTLVKRVK